VCVCMCVRERASESLAQSALAVFGDGVALHERDVNFKERHCLQEGAEESRKKNREKARKVEKCLGLQLTL
jgi:hypothetical protein